ncbi:MAG: hypothetical protein KAI83_04900 [Thiomargarita sp.]|nr:hypothetical protein [Thiomargarita sp.]
MEYNALALLFGIQRFSFVIWYPTLTLSVVRSKLKRFRGLSFSSKNLNLELLF